MASDTVSYMALAAANNAAAEARRVEEHLTKMECKQEYIPQKCDSLCVHEDSTWLKDLKYPYAQYHYEYTNECHGPIPSAYDGVSVRGDFIAMVFGGLIVFLFLIGLIVLYLNGEL